MPNTQSDDFNVRVFPRDVRMVAPRDYRRSLNAYIDAELSDWRSPLILGDPVTWADLDNRWVGLPFKKEINMSPRTDNIHDSMYYQITDKSVILYNWLHPTPELKITSRFPIAEFNVSREDLPVFLTNCINAFRNRYGTAEKLEKTVVSSFTSVVPSSKEAMDVALPKVSIHNLMDRFKSAVSSLESRYAEARKLAGMHIRNLSGVEDVADFIHRVYILQESTIKIIKLNELNEQLVALSQDKQKEVFIAFNRVNVDYCYKAVHIASLTSSSFRAKNKEVKWQYKLASLKQQSASEAKHASALAISLINALEQGTRANAMRLTKYAPEAAKDFTLSLKVLYPELKYELKQLRRDLENGTPLYPYMGVHIESRVLQHYWKRFNDIKVNLMMLGFSERATVKLLSYVFKCPIGMCEITKQLLPNKFLVPVRLLGKDTVCLANAYYLHTLNSGDMRSSRFNFEDVSQVVEQAIRPRDYYHSGVRNHTYNSLTFLSPRAKETENVRIYGKNKTFRPVPYMGVELEVERKDGTIVTSIPDPTIAPLGVSTSIQHPICDEDVTERVYDLLGRDFVVLKRDGSLGGYNPFEIVTIPATLQYHQKKWEEFLSDTKYRSMLTSYASGNCGMHVHISRDSFSGLHLAKFMRFMNLRDNHAFVTKVAQRAGNRYAAFAEKSLKECAETLRGPENTDRNTARRVAVNCTNANTIEVRIFRGNLSKLAFLKNLEFVHAVWEYTKDAGMQDLNYKKFIFWLFDTSNETCYYKHLKLWLVNAGYNVSNIRVVNPLDNQKAKKARKMQLLINRKYKPEATTIKFGSSEPILKSKLLESA